MGERERGRASTADSGERTKEEGRGGRREGQREAEEGGVSERGEDHHTRLISSRGQVMEHGGESKLRPVFCPHVCLQLFLLSSLSRHVGLGRDSSFTPHRWSRLLPVPVPVPEQEEGFRRKHWKSIPPPCWCLTTATSGELGVSLYFLEWETNMWR